MSKVKILNLYAGIGGNRKYCGNIADIEVTGEHVFRCSLNQLF